MSIVIIFTLGYLIGGVTGLTLLSLTVASSRADRMFAVANEAHIFDLRHATSKSEKVVSGSEQDDISAAE